MTIITACFKNENVVGVSSLVSFYLMHLLIWWRAVRGGVSWLRAEADSLVMRIIAGSWLLVLYVAQIATLIAGVAVLARVLACWQGNCVEVSPI
jgi:hypothetical protein